MKYFMALCLASLMAFAGSKENKIPTTKLDMKDIQLIEAKNVDFIILCLGDYAFFNLPGKGGTQPINISTGKPMSCDEAKKAFFK
jgi:hypothetical protein